MQELSGSSNHYVLTGVTFIRSRAIMGYLVNQYGKDDSLYPTDSKKRAMVDQRLYFDAGTLQTRNTDYSVRVVRNYITFFLVYHVRVRVLPLVRDTWWYSWLRNFVTSRKVAGSIPNRVIGFFHWHNPSGRTMALGLTQPLTEMSTRNVSGSKGGRCVLLTTLLPSCADCLEIWEPQPSGTLRTCPGL
jgi:hypothetical protein